MTLEYIQDIQETCQSKAVHVAMVCNRKLCTRQNLADVDSGASLDSSRSASMPSSAGCRTNPPTSSLSFIESSNLQSNEIVPSASALRWRTPPDQWWAPTAVTFEKPSANDKLYFPTGQRYPNRTLENRKSQSVHCEPVEPFLTDAARRELHHSATNRMSRWPTNAFWN